MNDLSGLSDAEILAAIGQPGAQKPQPQMPGAPAAAHPMLSQMSDDDLLQSLQQPEVQQQQPEVPGMFGLIADHWIERNDKLNAAHDNQAITGPERGLQQVGQVAGGINDTMAELVSPLIPDRVKNDFAGASEYIGNSRLGKAVGSYMKENPRLADNLSAVGNIAGVAGSLIPEKAALDAASMVKGLKKPVLKQKTARGLGGDLFKKVDAAGHKFDPTLTDDYMNSIIGHLPKDANGAVIAGNSPIVSYAAEMKALDKQPLTMENVMEMERRLGEEIDRFSENGFVKKEGLPFVKIKNDLRQMVKNSPNVPPELDKARSVWADSYKLGDIEKIEKKASTAKNPAQARAVGYKKILEDEEWFDPDEQKLIQQAAETGMASDLLQQLGSRLNPMVGGAMALHMGPVAAAGAYLGTAVAGKGARSLADALQKRPGNKLAKKITKRIGENVDPAALAAALKKQKGKP